MSFNGLNILEQIITLSCVSQIAPTGSQVICNPKPDIKKSDFDVVVLVESQEKFREFVEEHRYIKESVDANYDFSSAANEIPMACYRHQDINLIVTDSPEFFSCWVTATKICKKKNILDKEKRIELFDSIFLSGGFA